MNIEIKNRKNQKIVVLVDEAPNQKGLAFVMHGLGGFKEQKHIYAIAKTFRDNNYTVIRFDTTNTFGESDGNYEDATTTNYYEDLVDVINWAKKQDWYQKPFVLVGHSIGSLCIAFYAEKNPKEVKALVPLSTVVSGTLSLEAYPKEKIEEWDKSGFKISPSESKPGVIKKLNWRQFKEDKLKYDLLEKVDVLTMPVLLIVGDKDDTTPYKHQKILYDKLPGKKELHIINGAGHTFREPEHLKKIKEIIDKWIKSLEQEFIDIVNENDKIIGKATRKDAFEKGLMHRAAAVLIINNEGKILVQKRAATKKLSPGLFDASSAGGVHSGESYEEAAKRELQEDLGIISNLKFPDITGAKSAKPLISWGNFSAYNPEQNPPKLFPAKQKGVWKNFCFFDQATTSSKSSK